jgi:hypothetical protein
MPRRARSQSVCLRHGDGDALGAEDVRPVAVLHVHADYHVLIVSASHASNPEIRLRRECAFGHLTRVREEVLCSGRKEWQGQDRTRIRQRIFATAKHTDGDLGEACERQGCEEEPVRW